MNLILVIGKIGTGKTTVSKKLSKALNYDFIEVSSIVKEILKVKDRPRGNKLTGEEVGRELLKHIERSSVISGIRQKEILDIVERWFDTVRVKLTLPIRERFRRVNLERNVDWKIFREEDKLDQNLGLSELEFIKYDIKISSKGSVSETVEELLRRLQKYEKD